MQDVEHARLRANPLLLAFMNNQAKLSEKRFHLKLTQRSLPLPPAWVGMFILLAISGVARSSESQTVNKPLAADAGQNSPAEDRPHSAAASTPSSTDSQTTTAHAQSLAGRAAEDVEATLGKPTGKLQTAQGALWLYAEWRVQFDKQGRVLKVEKDKPVRLAKLDPQFVATVEAADKAAAERAAEADAARAKAGAPQIEKISILSNGGQQVDLPSLLAEGKVTIVDFYAEWCGPCQRLSPHLEQLAKDEPDVVLLKIDIVNWSTPVVQPFGIRSVPNVRVFDRTGKQRGDATSDFSDVLQHVIQAKKS